MLLAGATGYLWSDNSTAALTPSTASAGSTTYTVTVSAPANCPSSNRIGNGVG
ncbi:MAG: hypothetical protein IPN94_16635 [Sphingobacteriales bacterium]|nr:hypothetical protein [Sphingobacteriales bacterium]